MEEKIVKIEEELTKEKYLTSKLKSENERLKKKIGELTRSSESEEEFITNALLKRMNKMRDERAKLAVEVEQEEEQMTNALMKRIADLENQVKTLNEKLAEQ